MRKLARLGVLLFIVSACGGSTVDSTTTAPVSEPTPTSAVTTPNVVETTSSDPSTTTPGLGGNFALTIVSLGDLGQVVVQNIGGEAASLAGHWLCQRPSYYQFPDVVLQPGETAAVSVGGDIFVPPEGAVVIDGVADIGPFSPESGEVGLYFGSAFSDPNTILSYVEWGSSGHGRSDTAVTAGIWPDGGFVTTTADSGALLATSIPPNDPADWIGG